VFLPSSVAPAPSADIGKTLAALARRYPAPLVRAQLDAVPRIAFNIELVRRLVARENAVVADIGGGIGTFSLGCSVLGMEVTLVDDFGDKVNRTEPGKDALALHRELGVNVVACDATRGLSLRRGHFDAVSCFDSMEHMHNSPRAMFHTMVESLRPGGWFVLNGPNCVNLRKRLTVPLGIAKWSSMAAWYDDPVFRGLVREPDVSDLRYIAADLGLKDVKIIGRNWHGFNHPTLRPIMPLIDRLLRPFPSLCANIYLVGRKA
jgi:SAM-dependent methyltransferase